MENFWEPFSLVCPKKFRMKVTRVSFSFRFKMQLTSRSWELILLGHLRGKGSSLLHLSLNLVGLEHEEDEVSKWLLC